jgi:uncharacterized protein (UPF0254 family)
MATKILKIELPEEEVNFVESYAKEHGRSVADLLDIYIQRLQRRESADLHPEVKRMTGILPEEIQVEDEYRTHVLGKHK